VIQGGGFKSQNGQGFKPFAELLAANGIAAALIAYRGLPEHTYQTTLADVGAALRCVRAQAQEHGIDPQRIGVTGRSAGATLAALLAVGDLGEPGDGPIQAAVCISGVYDFIARFSDAEQLAAQPQWEEKLQSNGEWVGAPFAAEDAAWRRVSSINHIDPSDPPILFLHSRDDRIVPWQQSQQMFERMRAAGVV
jgi:acetyl esterase/lipase